MVRNLMLILGLSLTIAAFGCSDDDDNGGGGGTAGDGGSGGTAGDGGAGGDGGGEGACTNAADTAIVCDAEFTAAVTSCGTSNIGAGPEAIATCVAEDTGASAECATCFGETTQCTIDNCIQAGCAADPMGEECTNCRAENCDEAFNACAGAFDCGA